MSADKRHDKFTAGNYLPLKPSDKCITPLDHPYSILTTKLRYIAFSRISIKTYRPFITAYAFHLLSLYASSPPPIQSIPAREADESTIISRDSRAGLLKSAPIRLGSSLLPLSRRGHKSLSTIIAHCARETQELRAAYGDVDTETRCTSIISEGRGSRQPPPLR